MICSFILFGKRDSCAQGDLTTYNAMPPKKIMFFGKQVHGAPLPFGTSGSLGKKLSHDLAGWYSLPQRMGVIPVGGNDRSDARRVGKECVSTCRSRCSTYH